MSKDVPQILPYPTVLNISDVPEIKERLTSIIDLYPLDGISILMFFADKKIGIKIGDWDGNEITGNTLEDVVKKAKSKTSFDIQSNIQKIYELMTAARIKQSLYYISSNGLLVDVRTHIDKMISPGMLRDIYGKIIPTQNIIETKPLTNEILNNLSKPVILKTNSFKTIIRGNEVIPLYAVGGK